MKRKKLPSERKSITHKAVVGGTKIYITVGFYEDGNPGEVFIAVSKEGDEMRLMDIVAICISIGLQYGIPLEVFTAKLKNQSMGTLGATSDPQIPMAKSLVDYMAKWLDNKFEKK